MKNNNYYEELGHVWSGKQIGHPKYSYNGLFQNKSGELMIVGQNANGLQLKFNVSKEHARKWIESTLAIDIKLSDGALMLLEQ